MVIGIGYLSFDASVKIKSSGRFASTKTNKTGYGGVKGYIRHIDRGTDRKNGCEVQHGNPDINPEFTLENESYYKDSNGEWKATDQSSDMVGAIEARVEYARKHGARIYTGGKNDTVIVRPLVVQLGGDAVAGHEDTWAWDVIGILEGMFGERNITGFSIHKDETNPHIHVCFVPCHETEKGGKTKAVLSQTKFFKNPKQLAGLHKKIRKSLLDKGYEIELENKPIEEALAGYTDKNGVFHQQGLTPEQLKELSAEKIKLKIGEMTMNYELNNLNEMQQMLNEMLKKSKAERDENERLHNDLLLKESFIDSDRAQLQARLQELNQEKAKVQEMKDKVYSVAETCDQILADEKSLNRKFMEFLEREGKRTGKSYAEFVAKLYEKFQKERRDSLSDWQKEMLLLRKERMQGKTFTGSVPGVIEGTQETDLSFTF